MHERADESTDDFHFFRMQREKVSILNVWGETFRKGRPSIFITILTFPVIPVNSPLEVRLEALLMCLMMAPVPLFFCHLPPQDTHSCTETHRHLRHIHTDLPHRPEANTQMHPSDTHTHTRRWVCVRAG